MEKKITKREMFANIIANYGITGEDKAFLEHEIELLERKSGANRKPSAKQVANLELKEEIFQNMENGRAYKCSEIAKEKSLNTQKVAPILNALANEGRITKTSEKGVSYFTKGE